MKHSERLRQCPVIEPLEGRRLLAAPITEYAISAGSGDITAGPDGNLWFTSFDNQIGRITPAGQITEFPVPPSSSPPNRITAGPDGNLWFTYVFLDYQIGRITPAGQVTVFPTPSGNGSSVPFEIAAGPDGNLWFTEQLGKKIGRLSPAGQVAEFPVSLSPGGIAAGPDGNLWFTETGPGQSMIGRVTPSGQVAEFPLRGVLLSGETFGPDGNLWFTERAPETTPSGSTVGSAKRIEFLSRMAPDGQISEIPLSGFAGGEQMTFGPDGNLWFTDGSHDAIGRITPTGLAAEFAIPTTASGPIGIVTGPDGNLWFSESDGEKIGRFRVATTDLRLTIPAPTLTGTVGQPLTYTIGVTNDGPTEATDVVLTEDLPAPDVPIPVSTTKDSRSVIASQGTVETTSGGGFLAELGDLPAGATATVTIVLTTASPRTIASQLTVHANESDTNSGNDTAYVSIVISRASSNPPSSKPPRVLGLHAIRAGRKGLTAVVVDFDQPMDPGRVSDTGIYHLASVGRGKRPRLKVVGLASASYDAASRSVRLALKKPFKTGSVRLTIDHSAALAANGLGLAGGDFVASIPH